MTGKSIIYLLENWTLQSGVFEGDVKHCFYFPVTSEPVALVTSEGTSNHKY
jgi:hypothetical protein